LQVCTNTFRRTTKSPHNGRSKTISNDIETTREHFRTARDWHGAIENNREYSGTSRRARARHHPSVLFENIPEHSRTARASHRSYSRTFQNIACAARADKILSSPGAPPSREALTTQTHNEYAHEHSTGVDAGDGPYPSTNTTTYTTTYTVGLEYGTSPDQST
jgi:hypothetical protein